MTESGAVFGDVAGKTRRNRRMIADGLNAHPGPDSHGMKFNHFTEMCSSSKAGSYLRLIGSCSLSLRLKDLVGPVTRVNKSCPVLMRAFPTWGTPKV